MTNDIVTWVDLLEIYQNSIWIDEDTANLTVANDRIRITLERLESSDLLHNSADIALINDQTVVSINSVVAIRIGVPRRGLGLLVKDWDALFASSLNRMREPKSFFIRSDKTSNETAPPTETLNRYRATTRLVKLLTDAALFSDEQQGKIVFYGDTRIEVPVKFVARDLEAIDISKVDSLTNELEGDLHAEQRLGIFADAVMELAVGQSPDTRFSYLMRNVGELVQRVKDGYRLFASSFSYSKIRGELEKTQSEYVTRIHKTFSDIQGQLLGLPVASVVVATQLKSSSTCDSSLWSNVAVVFGACLFAALLLAACLNQWMTLNAISREIGEQRRKFDSEFKEIEDIFLYSFKKISCRIVWQRSILCLAIILSIVSAALTIGAYNFVTHLHAWSCIIPHGTKS
ncbi:hypothetical protein [Asaia bogorensis]|uniref:hypothetical protein n=1 Tax=Asaia bogorensis TaxID=91915 RepID=UPI000EFBBF54|nr:hypothetical protein [Asaia bogorensis]